MPIDLIGSREPLPIATFSEPVYGVLVERLVL